MEQAYSESEQKDFETALARQYVTFKVGRLLFGVEVETVQEIIRNQPMTPVPLSPTIVKGLVNLRGQIITAIDMRSLLELPTLDGDVAPMNVVVKAGGEVVSLLVDAIGDVIDVERSSFEATPETVAPHIAKIVNGVFKLEKQLLLVLNSASCVGSIEG